MTHLGFAILTLFILIPAIAAAVRLPVISSEFDPFIIAIWLRAFNAAFGLIIQHFGYNNIVHYNFWFLGDALILLWAFKKWNLFESNKFYRFLVAANSCTWLAETIFFSKLSEDYNSYFRIVYCFIVILMSISMVNTILLKAAINPLRNSVFLICCTLVLLNAITVIAEAFLHTILLWGMNSEYIWITL